MRLIDADALYKSFGASGNCNNCPLDAYKCQYYNEHTLMEFCERIDDAPTVDAEPVVRCRDCKHRDPEDHKCDSGALERAGCVFPVGDDYFCAFGERKEDADT